MVSDYVEERNGGLYVAGSRVSLDSIVYCFNEGLSPETITREFEILSLGQVYGAIAHYLNHQPAINGYLLTQRQRSEAAQSVARPLPEAMRQRINAAREHISGLQSRA